MAKKRESKKSANTPNINHEKSTPTFRNTNFNVEDVSKNIDSNSVLEVTTVNKLKLKNNREENTGITFKTTRRPKKTFKAKNGKKIPQIKFSKPVLNTKMMMAGVESVLSFVVKSAEKQESKSLFQFDAQPILLQVGAFRVPITPRRYLRFSLPNTLWTATSNVCLFVKDSSKFKRDFEPSVKLYEDILKKNSITEITQVIPLKQVLSDYGQHEQKRQLCNQFDMFLSDAKVCGHVLHYIGRDFEKKRKIPTPLHMDAQNLKREVTKALSKTMMTLHSNGSCFTIKVGHTWLSPQEIVANIRSICDGLSQKFPGNWSNIKNIYIKTETSLAVPLYVSMKSPNNVKVPKIFNTSAKHSVPVEGEISTRLGMRVTVFPSGDVITSREKIAPEFESYTEIQQDSSEDRKSKITKHQKKRQVDKKDLTEEIEEMEDVLAETAEEAYLTEWQKKRQDDELRKGNDKSETPKKKKYKKA